MLRKKAEKFVGRQRLSIVISLCIFASKGKEKICLLPGFYTLCDHSHIKGRSQIDDKTDNFCMAFIT